MKLLFCILVLMGMFAASACSVYAVKSSQRTSSARAAYGSATPNFKANKKKNQKRKKKAAKRKKVRNNRSSYFQGRPY